MRSIALGEAVAPYRTLSFSTGVVPLGTDGVLSASQADAAGHRGLASWLRDAEQKWNEHSNKKIDGSPRNSLTGSINYMGKLTYQSQLAPIRVLYTKAGTRLSACWLENSDAVIDHKAYWAAARSFEEAAYVVAVLNSALVLERVKDLQPVGQRDPRDFDNLVWTLPIPEFDPGDELHCDLAAAAIHAASIAEITALSDDTHFTTKRGIIREALEADGVAQTIERLVDALLPG